MNASTRRSLVFGSILIAIGLISLLGRTFNFVNMGSLWPLIVIGIGGVFFAGMVMGGKSTGALAIPGSIITTIGLILLMQNIFGWWETWSYAWGLIISSVGIGLFLFGQWSDQPELRGRGLEVARVGLILFLVFGAIFELIFSFTGLGTRGTSWIWAVILILAGLVQLGVHLFRLLRPSSQETGASVSLFGPIFLMGIGLLALLVTLDLVPTWRLLYLVNLWPLLLIGAGISLIFRRQSAWIGGAFGILLVAAMLVVALAGDRLGLRTDLNWMSMRSIAGQQEIHERITGSGNRIEETRTLDDFSRITLNIGANIEVVPGDAPKLVVTGDDNVLEHLTYQVRSGGLVLDVEPGIELSLSRPIEFVITVTDLEQMTINGAGDVQIAGLQTERLNLDINGAANFKISDFQAESLDLNNSGSGTVTVDGMVEDLEVRINGAGNFNGADLHSQKASVEISGFGRATVWVDQDLSTNIGGAGFVDYYGDPSVHERVTGAGSTRRVGAK